MFQEFLRTKDIDKSKNIKLQALNQTLESDEFKNPDKAMEIWM